MPCAPPETDAEGEQKERDRPREDPRRHGDEDGTQPNDADAGEDPGGSRCEHADDRRGKRRPPRLRRQERDGEGADRHEGALAERRHARETDRDPQAGRREREIEAVRDRVDVYPGRRSHGNERNEHEEDGHAGVPGTPGGTRFPRSFRDGPARALGDRRHSSSSTASS